MGCLGEALVLVTVAFVMLPLLSLWMRRRWLSNRGGVFDCGLRLRSDRPAWMLGIARYELDVLEWYRVFSISPRPKLVLRRGYVELRSRRQPDQVEAVALFDGSEIVRVRVTDDSGQDIELAMARESVVGMMSWIEAGPRSGFSYPGDE